VLHALTPTIASIDTQIDSGSLLLALPIAMLAGLVSFVSPCVLPLVPGYLTFVTGMSAADLQLRSAGSPSERPRLKALVASRVMGGGLLFILGYSLVFVALGAAFGGLGDALRQHEI